MSIEQTKSFFVETNDDKVQIPDNLSHLEQQMRDVSRFDGLLPDDDLAHSSRMIGIARRYVGNNEELERMIWVHDIPEIVTGDTRITKKMDSITDEKPDELVSAKRLLGNDDYKLYARFSIAERWLYGADIECDDPIATLACVIDKVEGNTFYHRHASQNHRNSFEEATTYTTKQKEQFATKLSEMSECDEKGQIKQILDDQIEYVTKLWS